MKVIIMYRNSFEGGDGWIYYPKHITIGDNCPICNAKRGMPYNYHFCEDGEWFDVTGHPFLFKNGHTIKVRHSSIEALIKKEILTNEFHPKLKNALL